MSLQYRPSTHYIDQVLQRYLGADDMAFRRERNLLIAWVAWRVREFGSIGCFGEGLRESYLEADRALGIDLFSKSRLFSGIPARELENLVLSAMVLHDESRVGDPAELAFSLIGGRSITPKPMLSLGRKDLGRLMTDAIGKDAKGAVLYHKSSLAALCELDHPETATLVVQKITPLILAVTTLLGATVELLGDNCSIEESSDFVISVPQYDNRPFPHASETAESKKVLQQALQQVIAVTKKRGAIYFPPDALHLGEFEEARKTLVEHSWLHALIRYPTGSRATQWVCIVIDKTREAGDPVRFVDVAPDDFVQFIAGRYLDQILRNRLTDWAVAVSPQHIQRNGYDLRFNRYSSTRAVAAVDTIEGYKKDCCMLGDVADIITPSSLLFARKSPKEPRLGYRLASAGDVTEAGILMEPERLVELSGRCHQDVESQLLLRGDILLMLNEKMIRGTTIGYHVSQIALVPDYYGDNWAAGKRTVIIRPKDSAISAKYLHHYLTSDLLKTYLNILVEDEGAKSRIGDIPIERPSPEQKERVENSFKAMQDSYAAIEQLYKEIAQMKKAIWRVPE